MIDFADIVTLYEYGRVRSDGGAYVESPPTTSSLAMIRQAIGCELPLDFVKFAKACPSYTSYFALLGEDVNGLGSRYEPHIIFLFRHAPEGYVPLVQEQDYYYMFQKCNPEGPIYNLDGPHFNPDDNTEIPATFDEVAPNFRQFLEGFAIRLAIGVRSAQITEERLREIDERERFVLALLSKYPGANEIIKAHA